MSKPKQTIIHAIDATRAVYWAGNDAYHFVKSLQENTEANVIEEHRRDILREHPGFSVGEATIRAGIQVECKKKATAAGNGRSKRVREALKRQKTASSKADQAFRPTSAKA